MVCTSLLHQENEYLLIATARANSNAILIDGFCNNKESWRDYRNYLNLMKALLTGWKDEL